MSYITWYRTKHTNLILNIFFGITATLLSLFMFSPGANAASGTVSGSISSIGKKCLDNRYGKSVNDNPVQVYTCNNTVAQEWKFFDDNTIRVHGLCLDARNGIPIRQAQVVINTCDRTTSQRWNVNSDGLILNTFSQLCLETKLKEKVNSTPAVLNSCDSSSAQKWQTPQPVKSSALYEPIDGKTYLGVAVHLENLSAFNQAAGIPTHPAIYNSFTGKDGDFQYQFKRLETNPELTPLITWNVTFTNNIIVNGSKDEYIQAAADSAKAYGKPVFLRLNWEMNGFWSSNYDRTGGVSPQQYIASWRYIYDIFKTTAPNVAFVWAPNGGFPKNDALGVPKLALTNWYPGDSYTDWIGFSSYPEYSTPPSTVLTKPEGLNYIAEYAKSKRKPLMLAEWARGGLGSIPTQDTSTPFDLIFGWANTYPNTVKALVYFDEVDSRDHVLETHPVGAAAFRSYITNNPRYDIDTVQSPN